MLTDQRFFLDYTEQPESKQTQAVFLYTRFMVIAKRGNILFESALIVLYPANNCFQMM